MATSTSPVVIRSLYRSLLRSAKPFSPPSPNYAVYASLLQRSGISHDWEECIYKLEKKRCKKRQDNDNGSSTDNNNNSSSSSSSGSKNKSENIIPKSWARNLSRSYADLREDYQNYKQSLEYDEFHDDDDDDDDDDDWDDEVPIMGSSSLFHDQNDAYNVDQDPKFILFRHLLREWFAGSSGDTSKDEAVDKDNSWPRQWSPDEEGYYENGKIKQVPLMRFPSQIMDCDGLSIRQIIQREFRAPSVEEKDIREFVAKEIEGKTSAAAAAAKSSKEVYPPSSYIDDPIRLQSAFLTLQELNRKLAWAEKIGLPKPHEYETNRRTIEWKRLVQAAKGVRKFTLSTAGKPCGEVDDSSPLPVEDEYDTKSNDDKPPRSLTPSSALDCGTLLIAHPLMTGYFQNSVIILLDHTVAPSKTSNEDPSNTTNESKSSGGTYGLIINRLALETSSAESTQSRLEILRQRFEEKKERDLAEIILRANDQVSTEKAANDELPHKPDVIAMSTTSNARRPISLLQAVSNDDLPETVRLAFGDAPIREGGPVNLSLQMIHRAAEQSDLDSNPTDKEKCKSPQANAIGGTVIPSHIEPNTETERTFFGGDVMKASYAVLEGVKDADDFSFIIGASCWSPGQLENEIQRGCWLPFCGPSSMAMSGMCEHYDTKELGQLCSDHDIKDEENINSSKDTKLSSFPPRPSNAANLSVAGSAARGSNNTKQSLDRPAGNLWLSIMCALSQGEADLAYVMLDSSHVKDDLGDSCDNFYR